MKCQDIKCDKILRGKQIKFCSSACMNRTWKLKNREIYLKGKKEYREKNKQRIMEYNMGVRRETRRLSKKIIKKVYDNSGHSCINCKSEKLLNIHHIKPILKGGSNNIENLMLLCWECHMEWHRLLKGFWK